MVQDGTRRVGAGDDERSHLLHPHILLCDMCIALGVHVMCMHMCFVFGAYMHACVSVHQSFHLCLRARYVMAPLLWTGLSAVLRGLQLLQESWRRPLDDLLSRPPTPALYCLSRRSQHTRPFDPTSLHSSSRVRHTCIAAAYPSLPLRQQRPRRTGSVTHRVPAQHSTRTSILSCGACARIYRLA